MYVITSPQRRLRGIVFILSVCVCVCLCVCVRPIFWYFISRLLEDISIWNLYRILTGLNSINYIDLHRSKIKVTGTVHYFLKVQSYHKNWATEHFPYFFCIYLFVCPIKWNNKNLSKQNNDVITKYVNIWRLTCKTPIPKLLFLIKSHKKTLKYGSHTAPSYSYSLSVCRSDVI